MRALGGGLLSVADRRRLALYRKVSYDFRSMALRCGECDPRKGTTMRPFATNLVLALGIVTIGLAIAAAGIYIGETDDAPGAAIIGIVAALGALTLAVKTALRKTEHP